MIERIFIYSGFEISHFLRELHAVHPEIFVKHKIFFPDIPYYRIPGIRNQTALYYYLKNNTKKLYSELQFIHEAAIKHEATSILIGIWTSLPDESLLIQLSTVCKKIFHDSKQHFFIEYPYHVDKALETYVSYYYQVANEMTVDNYLEYLVDFWPTTFSLHLSRLLSLFGKENISCGGESEVLEMLSWFTGFPDIRKPFHIFPKILPREVLYFMAATIPRGCAIEDCMGKTLFWPGQLRNFTKEKGFQATHFSLLGPKRRKLLIERCSGDINNAASLLGKQVSTQSEPEPSWQPFNLDPDSALLTASYLDPDFAASLYLEMSSEPSVYRQHDSHIVLNALSKILPHQPSSQIVSFIDTPPKLSVLTLTYNHRKFIGETIESVLAQRIDVPFIHIIGDDCSDDGTQDIILEYAAKYKHIIPVFQKRRSYGSQNIHDLFNMARTEYVALCDGDDFFTDPDKLQIQLDFLEKNKDCALCFHKVDAFFEDNTTPNRIYPDPDTLPRGIHPFYYLSDLIKYNFIQTNSVMYRWRFRNGLPSWFVPNLFPADWYWHLLHAEMGKIGFLNKVMSAYRRHSGGAFYLGEVDRLRHRAQVSISEVYTYKTINDHFQKKFEPILLDLVNGVFADCLLYDSENLPPDSPLSYSRKLAEAYPDFAHHFLNSVGQNTCS